VLAAETDNRRVAPPHPAKINGIGKVFEIGDKRVELQQGDGFSPRGHDQAINHLERPESWNKRFISARETIEDGLRIHRLLLGEIPAERHGRSDDKTAQTRLPSSTRRRRV